MPPAARIGDMHTCPMVDSGPKPRVGGPIITGEPTVPIGEAAGAAVLAAAAAIGAPFCECPTD